jgi:outer membrane protein assembly factor BamB
MGKHGLDIETGNILWESDKFSAHGYFAPGVYSPEEKMFYSKSLVYAWNFSDPSKPPILAWEAHVPGGGSGGSGLHYGDGKVFHGSEDPYQMALDAKTGEVLWETQTTGTMIFLVLITKAGSSGAELITNSIASKPLRVRFCGSSIQELNLDIGALVALPHTAICTLSLAPLKRTKWIAMKLSTRCGLSVLSHGLCGATIRGNSGSGQSGPTNLTHRWNFTTGGAVISSPCVVDGKVYVGSMDKNIYSLDALSGSLVWNYTTGSGIKSSLAVVNRKVYAVPEDGNVYCLNAENGSLIWKTPAGGYIPAHFDSVVRLRSSPIVVGGRVYVGSLDTNLYCLDANSGAVIWTFKTKGYITSSPAVVDGAVYIVSQEPTSGALYKLDANTREPIWKLEIPYEISAERDTDMHGSPTVTDGMVFVASNKLERYGINATTSNIEWTYRNIAREFIVDSMSYHDGKLFFVDLAFVVCANATNGVQIWKAFLGEVLESSTTYADGKVYVAGSDRRAVYVLNATTGDKLSWIRTGSKCWSSPTLCKGRMYIGNHDWNVYCFVDASFPIITTSIDANLNNDTVSLANAESVTVTGQLEPGIPNAPITVTFVKPDGTTIDRAVTTNEKGAFTISYTPDTAGNWTVTARYNGTEHPSRIYTQAYSMHLPLKIVEPQQPPLPPKERIPTEHIFAIVGVILIVVITTFLYGYIKKGKNNNRSPSISRN